MTAGGQRALGPWALQRNFMTSKLAVKSLPPGSHRFQWIVNGYTGQQVKGTETTLPTPGLQTDDILPCPLIERHSNCDPWTSSIRVTG